MRALRICLILAFALALNLGAFRPTLAQAPEIVVEDQESDGTAITVKSVTAVGASWLVILPDVDGKPGSPYLGLLSLADGTHSEVLVPLTPTLEQAPANLWAMLVADGGTIGVYEFPLFDQFVRVNGTALAEPFVVTALVEPVATPTATPTEVPEEPTATPTEAPEEPTATPTEAPEEPTAAPTEAPEEPTAAPTEDAAGEGEQTPVAVATPDGVPASGVHLSGNSFTLPTVLGVLTGLIAAVYAARRRR